MSIEAMKDALITLVFARGSIEDWGGYASEYFQNKHDLKGDISKVDKAIKSLRQAIEQAEKQEPLKIDGNTSDGYHTFNELYEFRKAYNVALFNEWASGGKCSVHKSWRHHDGELCFGGGWFIVVAVLPQGQISNHYEAKDWNLFAIPEVERALFEFDGHTGNDVIERLEAYTTPQPQQAQKQEPVEYWNAVEGWVKIDEVRQHFDSVGCGTIYKNAGEDRVPLYVTPQSKHEWVGLTEDEVIECTPTWGGTVEDVARLIEAKLKEKNT